MITEEKTNLIHSLYSNGTSVSKISKELHASKRTIRRVLKEAGIKPRDGFSYARKHHFDEHYFDVIDTEEKAYFLGFIYGDGNNFYKKNRISINLNSVDKEILEKFSDLISKEKLVKTYTRSNGKEVSELVLVSKHLSNHMKTLGIVQRKSEILTFPEWLDEKLHKHFIRGLIDSDGCVYIKNGKNTSHTVALIATTNINTRINDIVREKLRIEGYFGKATKQKEDVINMLYIKGYFKCKVFLDWIYSDCFIKLERKYSKYLEFIKLYDEYIKENPNYLDRYGILL